MESATAPLTWHDFLERMRHPSAADFVKSIKSFIVTFSNTTPDPDVDSRAVQEFLANMENAFRVHPLWADCSEEELDSAGEGLEKYVMTKLYNRTFATIPEDVRSDEELFEKMGLLQHFIHPENLDIKPEYQNETSWLLAQKELQKINLYKAPRDKLVCILNCCKVITNLLINASVASNDNFGADEFLPVLIYITIKANPPQLHSNLQYIQRFRRQTRLVSESAYYFTNILSAESFIWNIDGNALSIDEIEFQKKMNSARDILLGLTNNNNNINETNNNNNNNNTENTNNDTTVTTTNNNNEIFRGGNGDFEKGESAKQPTTLELEKRGSSEILKEDNLVKYFEEHPYLYARAGDLTVSDVQDLLGCYKRLVLQYVSLSKGMGLKPESEKIEPVKESEMENSESEILEPVKEIEPDKESEMENIESEILECKSKESEMENRGNEKSEPVKELEPVKKLEPLKELVDHFDA